MILRSPVSTHGDSSDGAAVHFKHLLAASSSPDPRPIFFCLRRPSRKDAEQESGHGVLLEIESAILDHPTGRGTIGDLSKAHGEGTVPVECGRKAFWGSGETVAMVS